MRRIVQKTLRTTTHQRCCIGSTKLNGVGENIQTAKRTYSTRNKTLNNLKKKQKVTKYKTKQNIKRAYGKYRLVKRKVEHVIGIRAEDDSAWERRTPLTPKHVEELLKKGIDVHVQESHTRCYSNEEYREVGAKVVESLSHVKTIFGVKEVPPHLLYADKTYCFFSHTHKGVKKNRTLVERLLEKNVRFIDYERITNEFGKRLVRFGHYAGNAAAIDLLHVVGERMLVKDRVTTQLINLGYAKNYSSLANAKLDIKAQGDNMARYGLPASHYPFTITIAGNGTVAQGIKEILELFPIKYVTPEELQELWKKKKRITRASPETRYMYVCVLEPKHFLRHKVTHKFDRAEYDAKPEEFESTFHRNVLPYTRVLFNALQWDKKCPHLLTKEQMESFDELPLLGIADLTAEPNGSIDFLPDTTDFETPFYLYNLEKDKQYKGVLSGTGIVMMSIPNWPSAFPKTSSDSFGDKLLPYVMSIVKENEMLPEVERAIIIKDKKFTPSYQFMEEFYRPDDTEQAHEDPKNVLLLGSGLVTGPIVEYLTRFKFVRLTIASADEKAAENLCNNYGRDRTAIVRLDAQNNEKLSELVKEHDVVLSLIPATMHTPVAKLCLEHGKPMITASYISPEMKQLDEEAKERSVLLLNEVGVDPGIDHMCVMQTYDEIREKKGELVSFQSYCGALPSPESSYNPLGYKFSWSPQGVITASQNPAYYKEAGVEYRVDGKSLLFNSTPLTKKATFAPGYAFEMVPNRDSMKYIDFYGFDPEKIKTMIRGTLRFPGFCNMFRCMRVFGLLDDETRIDFLGSTSEIPWRQLIVDLSPFEEDVSDEVLISGLVDHVQKLLIEKFSQLGIHQDEHACLAGAREFVTGMIKLGMLSETELIHKEENLSVMKATCNLLTKKLSYQVSERDMIFMHHEFIVNYPHTDSREKISAWICVYGDDDVDGFSATAKTVGLPVAITAILQMRGKFGDLAGVKGPTEKVIYDQTMNILAQEGIKVHEHRQNLFLDEYFDQ